MTLPTTNAIRDRLVALGRACGFEPYTERSPGVPKSYAPRTDLVLAGTPLTREAAQRIDAIAEAASLSSPLVGGRPPVVGIEIEGTDPTTKTMEADLLNLHVTGFPISVLAVDSAPGGARKNVGDIQCRASRLRRTLAIWTGIRPIAIVDASRITSSPIVSPGRRAVSSKPAPVTNQGGSREDARRMRDSIFALGTRLGLRVETDATPEVLEVLFDARAVCGEAAARVLLGVAGFDVCAGTVGTFAKFDTAFTAHATDILWSAEPLADLDQFHRSLAAADPDFGVFWPRCPFERCGIPLVAFEIDSGISKHTAGSLLHLARSARLGVLVVPDERVSAARELIETYRRVVPVGGVVVAGFSEVARW